jgi:hypothetical protein
MREGRGGGGGGGDDDDDDEPKERKARSAVDALGMDTQNPNAVNQSQRFMRVGDMKEGQEQKLSRREREAVEAERKRANYQRKHEAGETDEAKADLKRLAAIKKRRADTEKKAQDIVDAAAARDAAFASNTSDAGGDFTASLSAREIKGMNPNKLKELLKEKGLSAQGNKKVLQQRLIDAMMEDDL